MNVFLGSYLEHLRHLNYSPLTVKQRKSMLGCLWAFLNQKGIVCPDGVGVQNLKDYLDYRRHQGNRFQRKDSPSYQNQTLAAIREHFKYLKKEGHTIHNPSEGLEFVRVPQMLPKNVLTHEEFKKLIKATDPHTPLGYRDRTILEVLYSSAIRRTELLSLKVEDVDYKEGLALVLGKGNKERRVPLGKTACDYLESYIKSVRPMWVNKSIQSPVLFLTQSGNGLKANAFKKLIDKYVLKSKIETKITPHSFRRGAATGMIKNKANVMLLKDMLGHESLDTIKHYLKLEIEDLKAEHQRTHPREKSPEKL